MSAAGTSSQETGWDGLTWRVEGQQTGSGAVTDCQPPWGPGRLLWTEWKWTFATPICSKIRLRKKRVIQLSPELKLSRWFSFPGGNLTLGKWLPYAQGRYLVCSGRGEDGIRETQRQNVVRYEQRKRRILGLLNHLAQHIAVGEGVGLWQRESIDSLSVVSAKDPPPE